MHNSSLKRMEWFAKTYVKDGKEISVLDVGSYDVNGSYKKIFKDIGAKYYGLDMEDGPNVDICPKNAYSWDEIENDKYDVVISGQALEHIEFFWITMEEMIRVTKKGGLICIIAPNGFGEHRYPVDCWRFFTDGMIALARYFDLELIHAHTNRAPTAKDSCWFSDDCADSMLIARKNYSGKAVHISLQGYKCIPRNHDEVANELMSYDKYKELNTNSIEKSEEFEQIKTRKSLVKDLKEKIKKGKARILNKFNHEKNL